MDTSGNLAVKAIVIHFVSGHWGGDDGQMRFWSITDRLAELSAQGDPLETLAATVDFELAGA